MTTSLAAIAFPLFAPADRPERFAKALAAGADAVIFDFEDAVSSESKDQARRLLVEARDRLAASSCPALVRINPAASPHHEADLSAVRDLPLAAVVLPKAETADAARQVADKSGLPVWALIESARGLAAAREIATAAARLVFGSIDFAADLGCAHVREAVLFARCELVLASRIADAPAPLDGVTTSVKDADRVREDAAHAASLGFGGKLLIHPAQIAPAAAGFLPSEEETAWAERVIAAGNSRGAVALDGMMIDAPVRLRAEQILERARRGPR